MGTRIVKTLECLRCGYDWIPKSKKPRMCPKCKSYYYDTPRKKVGKKNECEQNTS